MSGVPVNAHLWRSKSADPPLYPRGRLFVVGFVLCLPNAATQTDIEEWLQLHLGCGSMAADNPLGHFEPEAFSGPVAKDLAIESDHHEAVEDALAAARSMTSGESA